MNTMNEQINEVMDNFSIFGFRSHQYPDVIGLWEEEQRYLVSLALQAPAGNWIEIGSHCGGSACLLATAIRNERPGTKLQCVDIDFEGFGGAFKRNVYKKGKFDDVVFTRQLNTKNLKDDLDYWGDLGALDKGYSFLYIDGWHTFRAVITEFEAAKPFLVSGAIVAFHDLSPRNTWVLEDAAYRAKANYDIWMKSEMPDIDGGDLQKFHATESQQDFLILEALAYILDNNPEFELLPLPKEFECDYSHLTGGPYRHSSTSPNNALAAIRKKV